MVDVKGSNNLLYLPLDRILGKKTTDDTIDITSPNTDPGKRSSNDKQRSRDTRENLRSRERR